MTTIDYSGATVQDLFSSSGQAYSTQTPAETWVEAENNLAIKYFLAKWFKMMEDGSAFKTRPDPLNRSWTMARAKYLVEELDKDFEIEANRWSQLEVEAGPEFMRLTGPALIAFAQQFDKIRKSRAQISEEAKRRLEEGEEIPSDALMLPLRLQGGYCGRNCSTPTPPWWFKEDKVPDHGEHTITPDEYREQVERAALLREAQRMQEYNNVIETVRYDSNWTS